MSDGYRQHGANKTALMSRAVLIGLQQSCGGCTRPFDYWLLPTGCWLLISRILFDAFRIHALEDRVQQFEQNFFHALFVFADARHDLDALVHAERES